jgi:ATP-dependent exoDNAse (exonuclease V) alpha subunit
MAIYHLTAKVVSRGKGDSSVAAAAYQSRSGMVDERTGEVHNYSRRADELLFEGIYAPKDAPDWARDRASLWNHVEAFERRKDAQLARSFNIALPHELTVEQGRYALQDWVRDNFTRKGFICDVAIHAPGAEGDDRNIHAHVLVVMRKLDGAELAAKKDRAATVADRKDELEALRESWERIGNRHLARHGFEPTLDRRSFEDRGIEQLPTVHLGKDVSALERDGVTTDRGDLNREIAAENERRVIDLAAEREKRTPEKAPSVDLAEQPEPTAPGVDQVAELPAAPAARQRQEPEAAIETRGAAAEPSGTPEIADRAVEQAEPATAIRSAEGVAGKVSSGLAKIVADVLGGFLNFLVGGPPKQTRQQMHDKAQAAGNLETLHAAAHAEAVEVKEAARDEQIFRADQETQLPLAAPSYFRAITRPANPADRERDDDREREIERER